MVELISGNAQLSLVRGKPLGLADNKSVCAQESVGHHIEMKPLIVNQVSTPLIARMMLGVSEILAQHA